VTKTVTLFTILLLLFLQLDLLVSVLTYHLNPKSRMIMVKFQGALEGVVLKQYCSSSSSIPTSTNQINPLRTEFIVKNIKNSVLTSQETHYFSARTILFQ
jgi:hypothetical protein